MLPRRNYFATRLDRKELINMTESPPMISFLLISQLIDQLVIQKEGEFVRLNNSVIAFLNRKAGPNFIPRIRVMWVSLKTTKAEPSIECSRKTWNENRKLLDNNHSSLSISIYCHFHVLNWNTIIYRNYYSFCKLI